MKKFPILLTLIIALTFAISSFGSTAFADGPEFADKLKDVKDIKYVLTDLNTARDAVKNPKKNATKFEIPDEMRNLIQISDNPDEEDSYIAWKGEDGKLNAKLKIEVYVIKPQGSIPENATSNNISGNAYKDGTYPTISLDKSGTYKFWILYGNLAYEENDKYMMSTKGLELKDDGWYKIDNTVEPRKEELIIPAFTFEYVKEEELTITSSGTSENGVVNRAFNDITFNITNGTLKEFNLQYRADDNAEWKNATEQDAEFDLSKFSVSSISFVPLKIGQYRVECKAKSSLRDEIKIEHAEIDVNKEYTEVKLVDTRVRDFFKNNWKSLIFLGLAVLSLAGIVVVALYKPKDAAAKKADVKEDENIDEAKAEDEAVEVAEESEDIGGAEEKPVEEAVETEEKPVEEKVEAEEKPAEETPAEAAEESEVKETAEEAPKAEEEAPKAEEKSAEETPAEAAEASETPEEK